MALEIFQVDAFTHTPFKGNPAAVCILPQEGDKDWMQLLANEMNLSETAFLYRYKDGYNLRWFTPAVEVDLCGHATLASAHILWETGQLAPDQQARFYSRSGLLTAERQDDWIQLDFPSEPEEETDAPEKLGEALGISAQYVGKNRFDYLIEVDSEEAIRSMKPDFRLLSTIGSRGFIVTSLADSTEFDFVSRFFAPGAGINEDPVTGSAHCCLGPYWQKRLGKKDFSAYQASPRGGVIKVQVAGERVILAGQAITVMRSTLI
ncbi:MAG: PhzF family phenazine biosynthesis protein [Desulfobacterales bacterium]|nr:MAG: PhzF family phenazine biosynthesis protein [Desulfobacterales bacterium]